MNTIADGLTLSARNISVSFPGKRGALSEVVSEVSLDIHRAQVLVLLGESGSGKTVLSRTIGGMPPRQSRSTGQALTRQGDVLRMKAEALRRLHGTHIGFVAQDPSSSLDPMRRVGGQIVEVLLQHGKSPNRTAARAEALRFLELVQLRDPERVARCYPHELSGGMRQRVAVAAALCCQPELLIADEPSSALDASVGARVVDLMDDLRQRLGTSVLFITHDIGIASRIARREDDHVAVMLRGRIVEHGDAPTLLADPVHPYTRALIAAEPSGRTPRGALAVVPDSVRGTTDWGRLVEVSPGHFVTERGIAA